ncbi:DUF4269 domain-containing protein [Pedobacter sp. CAN_A7]|uniref:DUF4269 domain-containing protein n=1 Tax=Pedobacter sp. CAN_A7 TaxID=2787722 RepID=UPI0018CA259C
MQSVKSPRIDFLDITYLKFGNKKQQEVYQLLVENKIMEKLSTYTPIFVGTIPLNIDIETSDIDIICYARDKNQFIESLVNYFQNMKGFKIIRNTAFNSVKANFYIEDFEFEIFGQDLESMQQDAYQHMIIEHSVLIEKGEKFRQEIIKLKKNGLKTEPAFAKLLGLDGNPYKELLKLRFD